MEILANIDVDDLGLATEFYCRAFDLTVGRRFGHSGIELLGASSAIYLLEKPAGSLACQRAGRRTELFAALDASAIWILSCPTSSQPARLSRAAGAIPESPMRTSRRGGLIAVFADPFGHGFCLIQFLNRGCDEIAS